MSNSRIDNPALRGEAITFEALPHAPDNPRFEEYIDRTIRQVSIASEEMKPHLIQAVCNSVIKTHENGDILSPPAFDALQKLIQLTQPENRPCLVAQTLDAVDRDFAKEEHCSYFYSVDSCLRIKSSLLALLLPEEKVSVMTPARIDATAHQFILANGYAYNGADFILETNLPPALWAPADILVHPRTTAEPSPIIVFNNIKNRTGDPLVNFNERSKYLTETLKDMERGKMQNTGRLIYILSQFRPQSPSLHL